ncbi:MAG: prefoldin subunit alpha [Candidatus Bathyarchaeia archaeon]
MSQVNNELERMVVELQLLENALDTIQTRMGLVNSSINELRMANATLEGLKKEQKGSTILVPLGGGSYMKAKIEDAERLIVGIGADVAAEKTVNAAQEDIVTRILELEKARNALQHQLEQTISRMEAVQRRVRERTQQTSAGPTENVREA